MTHNRLDHIAALIDFGNKAIGPEFVIGSNGALGPGALESEVGVTDLDPDRRLGDGVQLVEARFMVMGIAAAGWGWIISQTIGTVYTFLVEGWHWLRNGRQIAVPSSPTPEPEVSA